MKIFVNFTKASKTVESFCLFSPSPIIIRKNNKCKKLITPYILKSHVHVEVTLETSGDVLSTVNMVVQRCDGPRRLRDHDDDDDDDEYTVVKTQAMLIYVCIYVLHT